MKPSYKLIEALRRTARQIESGEEWNWDNPCSCNCGLLVNNLGVPYESIKNRISGFWTTSFHPSIEKEDLKSSDNKSLFYRILKDHEITYEDIVELEHIGREVIKQDKITEKETPESLEVYRNLVCSYIRDKADELESQMVGLSELDSKSEKVEANV